MPTKKQQERIDKGLCPHCGEEAAPFYLCPSCRRYKSIARKLDHGAKFGAFSKGREGRNVTYSIADHSVSDAWKENSKPSPLWNEGKGEDDKRLRPRLGKIPVDVETELMGIFLRLGSPLSEEEVVSAWGKLRVRRGRASAAGDLAALIKAERRRERRAAQRRQRDG